MFQFFSSKTGFKFSSSKSAKSSGAARSRSMARRKHMATGLLRCTGGERSRSCTPERNARISCRLPSEYTQLSPEDILRSYNANNNERLLINGTKTGKTALDKKIGKKKLLKSEKQKLALEKEQQKKKMLLQQNKIDSVSNSSSLKENHGNRDNNLSSFKEDNDASITSDTNINEERCVADVSNVSINLPTIGEIKSSINNEEIKNGEVNKYKIESSRQSRYQATPCTNVKNDIPVNDDEVISKLYTCNGTSSPLTNQHKNIDTLDDDDSYHDYENLNTPQRVAPPIKQIINSDNYMIRLKPTEKLDTSKDSNNNTDCNNLSKSCLCDEIKVEHRFEINRNNSLPLTENNQTQISQLSNSDNFNSSTKTPIRPSTLLSATHSNASPGTGIIIENDVLFNNSSKRNSINELNSSNMTIDGSYNNSSHQCANHLNSPHFNNHRHNSPFLKYKLLQYRSQPTTPDESSLDHSFSDLQLGNKFSTPKSKPPDNNFNLLECQGNNFMPNYPYNYINNLNEQLMLLENEQALYYKNNNSLNFENCSCKYHYGNHCSSNICGQEMLNCNGDLYHKKLNNIINGSNLITFRPTRTRLSTRFDDPHHRRSPGMGCRSAMMRKLTQCHCQPTFFNPSIYEQLNESQTSSKCEILLNDRRLANEKFNSPSSSTRASSMERRLNDDSGVCSVNEEDKLSSNYPIRFNSYTNSSCSYFSNQNFFDGNNIYLDGGCKCINSHTDHDCKIYRNNNINNYNNKTNGMCANTRPNSQIYDVCSIDKNNYFINTQKTKNNKIENVIHPHKSSIINNDKMSQRKQFVMSIEQCYQQQQQQTNQNVWHQRQTQQQPRPQIETVKRSRSTPCDNPSTSFVRLPLVKNLRLNLTHVAHSSITGMVVVTRNNFIVAVDMHSAYLFNNDGEFNGKIGGRNHRNHSLVQPLSVANCGDYCVAFNDRGQQNIKIFSLEDQLMFVVEDALFTNIAGLSCNSDGDIFIASTDSKCIFVFRFGSPHQLERLPQNVDNAVQDSKSPLCEPKIVQTLSKKLSADEKYYYQYRVADNSQNSSNSIKMNMTNNDKTINETLFENSPNNSNRRKTSIKTVKPIFEHPYCLAFNPTNNDIIVGDDDLHVIVAIDNQSGQVQWRFSPHEAKDGNFLPSCLCCDWRGNVFVGDSGNNKVYLLNSSGKFLKTILSLNNGLRGSPSALCTDFMGRLYVADEHSTVKIFKYIDDGSL